MKKFNNKYLKLKLIKKGKTFKNYYKFIVNLSNFGIKRIKYLNFYQTKTITNLII